MMTTDTTIHNGDIPLDTDASKKMNYIPKGIPEKSFSSYMQESIKTLEQFQPQDTLVYVQPPALDVTNVPSASILNLTTGTVDTYVPPPINSNSSNSNLTTLNANEFFQLQQNQQLQLSQINSIARNQLPLSKIITANFAPDTQNTRTSWWYWWWLLFRIV